MTKIFTSTTAQGKIEFGKMYRSQMSKKTYDEEMLDIMKRSRPKKTEKQIKDSKNLLLNEVVMFIEIFDAPAGYVLDNEMYDRVERLKRYHSILKEAAWIGNQKNI